MSPHVFPTILIMLDLAAAMVCAWHGDRPRAGYWLAAAGITTCVTWPEIFYPERWAG